MLVVSGLALLATWLTGFVQTGTESFGVTMYGFPLAWKSVQDLVIVQVLLYCPSCPVQLWPSPVRYNWVFFLVDSLFYFGLGGGTVLATIKWQRLSRRRIGRK